MIRSINIKAIGCQVTALGINDIKVKIVDMIGLSSGTNGSINAIMYGKGDSVAKPSTVRMIMYALFDLNTDIIIIRFIIKTITTN